MAFENVYQESLNNLRDGEMADEFELCLIFCVSECPYLWYLQRRYKNCVHYFHIVKLNPYSLQNFFKT